MTRGVVLIVVLLISFAPSLAVAEVLLEESGEFGPEPSSSPRQLAFEVQTPVTTPRLEATVAMTQGKASVRVTGPQGEVVYDGGTGASFQIMGKPLDAVRKGGTYHVHVVPERAVGTWTIRVLKGPEVWQAAYLAIPGLGMVIVGFGAVLLWRVWSRVRWRWFWAGAAVWAVGVALKFAWAIVLNEPVLAPIKASVPHEMYLAIGSIYIGLLTGVFEIGITLVAAILWKRMTISSSRGVAVGVGAGAFEAVLLGAITLLSAVVALTTGGQVRDQVLAGLAATETTPLVFLVAPAERVIATLCHTSSRALVLFGVARGRWFWPFAGGFLIMTAIDAVAGYVHLAGLLGTVSLWWIELAITPAAILSIPIVAWCIRGWPEPNGCPTRPPAVS